MDQDDTMPNLPAGNDRPNWEFSGTDEQPTAQIPAAMTPPPFEPGGGEGSTATMSAPPSAPRSRVGIIGLCAAVAAAFFGLGIGHIVWPPSSTTSSSSSAQQANPTQPVQPNFGDSDGPSSQSGTAEGAASSAKVAQVAAKVSPALVDINTDLGYQQSSAAGTGIVLSSNGTVLTNNHVISGATKITATDIGNGKTYNALVVGYDRSHDIAVIKLVGASGLTTASLGNSRTASVGQSVIGIGNAGGVGGAPSTAAGSITALNQSITASDEANGQSEQLIGLIQTNAPIQPGDSGGPLVSLGGSVLGVNTAASPSYSFNTSGSQGFSIPINTALSIAHEIIAGHASDTVHLGQTGFMGVQVQAASNDSTGGQTTGVSVGGTVSGSPAAQAGLAAGSTILSVNGTTVSTPQQLTALLGRYHPGDTVKVTWTSAGGTTTTSSITLAKGPAA